MVRLSEEQKADLTARIQKWLKRLKMGPWVIRIDESSLASDDTILMTEHIKGRQLAYIRVGLYFADDMSEAERENVVCHELLHSILRPLYDTFWAAIQDLSPSARGIAEEQFHHILERTIDHLANVLAPVDGIRADGEAAEGADQE